MPDKLAMGMIDKYPDLLTVDEVREILGVSRNVAYEAIRTGQIPSFRVGPRLIRVSRDALKEAIANGFGKAGKNEVGAVGPKGP